LSDITGFSAFINEPGIIHSKPIISGLPELIIKSNEIDVKVAEVEGDGFRRQPGFVL